MDPQTSQISLEKLLSCIEDGVFVIDGDRRVLLFNTACERMTGFDAAEVVGASCQCSDLMNCQDQLGRSVSGCLCPGFLVFSGERPTSRQRMRITTKSGAYRWVETTYAPLPTDNGHPGLIVGVMRDVSDAVERERELHEKIENLRQQVERMPVSRQADGSDDESANRLDEKLADVERSAILSALKNARGQRSLAAKMMGISRSRLYRRMEALGIVPRERGVV